MHFILKFWILSWIIELMARKVKKIQKMLALLLLKIVYIRSFSGPYFPAFDWIRRLPYSVRILDNMDQESFKYVHLLWSEDEYFKKYWDWISNFWNQNEVESTFSKIKSTWSLSWTWKYVKNSCTHYSRPIGHLHFIFVCFTTSFFLFCPKVISEYLQYTAQKMKFLVKDFFSKCDQICIFL